MADVEFDDFEGGTGARARVVGQTTRFLAMAGAATSVALVLGMGYWGYKLAVRDMTGIPVVRAIEGPMRIAPDDPGGQIADNQGLSVNSIAAEGGISPPADKLVLAPAPIGLKDDDLTGTALAMAAPVSGRSGSMPGLAVAPAPAAPAPEAEAVTVAEEDGSDPLQATSPDDQGTTITALIESLNQEAVPLSGDIDTTLDTTLDTGPKTGFSLPKNAVAQSPRPRARPAGQVTMAAASPAAPTETAEITGDDLASGTRLVQLGAFDTQEIARAEWQRLAGRFADLLTDKTRIVQSAKSGGRTFYRLRAMGFTDEADSRRFCSALVAERAACIPVAVR